MAHIFWVEDQSHWIDKFRDVLCNADFDGAKNTLTVLRFAQAARQKIAQLADDAAPDIAILDANMGGNDEAGFAVSAALRRKWPTVPIIYLSEHSGTEIEQHALEQFSATDFIAKHQRNVAEVLCWRIRAVLRKSDGAGDGSIIESGALRIDLESWQIHWRGVRLMNPSNAARPLAPTPRKILRELIVCSPRALGTAAMAEKIGSDAGRFSYSSYRQHIKVLRQSLGQAQNDLPGFMALCKSGAGIATFGDEHAYFWKPPRD